MSVWILIFMVWSRDPRETGVAVGSVSFHSQEMCQTAAKEISHYGTKTWCVEDKLPEAK